jgi:acyl carrier protein
MQLITPRFREVFEEPDLIVTDDLDASMVESWDSLNHITLIVELEQQLNIVFTADEFAAMRNVGDLIDCLVVKGFCQNGNGPEENLQ